MKNPGVLIGVLFWLALLADCLLIINAQHEYRIFTKTLLVPILLIGVYQESKDTKHTRSKMLLNIALLCCFLGDFFLLFDSSTNSGYFIVGLCSFFIAHLFFIAFFYRLKPFSERYRLYNFMTGVIILAYVMVLLFFIWGDVTRLGLQIPVTAYAIVLAFMLLTAFNALNNRSVKRLTKQYFIPGVILFVLSDSVLAFNKFSFFKFNYSGVVVMILYASALFLLTNGVLRFLKK